MGTGCTVALAVGMQQRSFPPQAAVLIAPPVLHQASLMSMAMTGLCLVTVTVDYLPSVAGAQMCHCGVGQP